MCKKCIILVRVSTNQQDLEAQKNEVYKVALSDGYKKDEIAIVEGKESAIKLKEEERKTLNELKEIIKENPSIESVYIYAIDRLARKVSVVLSVKDYLTDRGINLVFLHPQKIETMTRTSDGFTENKITTMLLMFLAYGAEMEMNIKKARFKTAKDSLRLMGKVSEGKPLFGYLKGKDDFVVIDESVAPYIKQAFEDYISKDISLDSIYQKFVSLNLLKLGNSRTGTRRISDLFHNLKYSGRTEEGKTIYPAIVSPELQDKVIANIKTKTSKPKTKSNNIYYCKGIIKNAKSNYTLIGKSAYCAYVDSYVHKTINLNVVDGIVWKICCDWLPLFENITTDEEKENIDIRVSELQQQIENNTEHLKEIDEKEKLLYRQLEKGKIRIEFYDSEFDNHEKNRKKIEKNNNSLKHQIESLEIQKKEISENNKVQNFVKYLEYSNIKDDAERFDLIHRVIKRVEIDFDSDDSRKITIYPVDKLNVERKVFIYTYEKKTKKQTLTDESGRKMSRYILDRYHQKDKHKKKK